MNYRELAGRFRNEENVIGVGPASDRAHRPAEENVGGGEFRPEFTFQRSGDAPGDLNPGLEPILRFRHGHRNALLFLGAA